MTLQKTLANIAGITKGQTMSQDISSLCRELLSLVKRIAPQECPLLGHKKQPTPDCVWCEVIATVKKADQVIPTHAVRIGGVGV